MAVQEEASASWRDRKGPCVTVSRWTLGGGGSPCGRLGLAPRRKLPKGQVLQGGDAEAEPPGALVGATVTLTGAKTREEGKCGASGGEVDRGGQGASGATPLVALGGDAPADAAMGTAQAEGRGLRGQSSSWMGRGSPWDPMTPVT